MSENIVGQHGPSLDEHALELERFMETARREILYIRDENVRLTNELDRAETKNRQLDSDTTVAIQGLQQCAKLYEEAVDRVRCLESFLLHYAKRGFGDEHDVLIPRTELVALIRLSEH